MKNNKNNNCNFPTLRFPEFNREWKEVKLKDICTLTKGAGISKDQLSADGIPCVLYGELYTKYKSEVIRDIFSRTNICDSNLVRSKANDVIIPSSGESAIDIATARCIPYDGVLLGGDLNIIRLIEHNGIFFSYQLNGARKREIAKVAQGVSVVHLYGEGLKNLTVFYPSNAEQDKIARFLSLIDERIATQNKIIAHLESLIKGLYSAISKIGWRNYLLSELMIERKELNTSLFPVYSVSVDVGLVDQIEHLGRSFAAKDTSNYNVVRLGDVVYTKSPTGSFPFGIVKQSLVTVPVAVSPLYGVYRPKSIHIGRIIQHYFASPIRTSNYLHSLIQKGAKNTINISTQHFLDKAILLPSREDEIICLSELLDSYNSKCELEKALREHLLSQKTYLLQKMFI